MFSKKLVVISYIKIIVINVRELVDLLLFQTFYKNNLIVFIIITYLILRGNNPILRPIRVGCN